MEEGFLEAVKAEMGRLEKALSADPRFIRLSHLQRLLSVYEMPLVSGNVTPSLPQIGRPPSPDRDKVINACIEIIASLRPSPVPTRSILNLLKNKYQLEIDGSNQVNSLSAVLSNSGKFFAKGRMGWSLLDELLRQEANRLRNLMPPSVRQSVVESYDFDGSSDPITIDYITENIEAAIGKKPRIEDVETSYRYLIDELREVINKEEGDESNIREL